MRGRREPGIVSVRWTVGVAASLGCWSSGPVERGFVGLWEKLRRRQTGRERQRETKRLREAERLS